MSQLVLVPTTPEAEIHAMTRALGPRPTFTRLSDPNYAESVRRRITHLSAVDENDCWVWLGHLSPKGYGKIQVGEARWAHRVSYLVFIDDRPIPEGHTIDHLCRNRACVNPFHLECVPHGENVRRGNTGITWKQRTHCGRGHPFDETNTGSRRDGRGGTCRTCRTCRRESDRRAKAKKKQEAAA